jgi:Bardet-Biedl syndrome 1 protein
MEQKESGQTSGGKIVWLTAFDDPVANIRTVPGALDLGCLLADQGDAQLVVADTAASKLRVYSGVALSNEQALLEPPVACCVYRKDDNPVNPPVVAVAAASCVFEYRQLRPFLRFALPADPVSEREAEVWLDLAGGKADAKLAQAKLMDARRQAPQQPLSRKGTELADAVDPQAVVEMLGTAMPPAGARSSITCMTTVAKSREDGAGAACLVLGTEAGDVLVLDPAATKVAKKIQLRSPPAALATVGAFDVDYRIVAATRDRTVHVVRNGEVLETAAIELDVQPVALAVVGRTVFVACMNKTIRAAPLRSAGSTRGRSAHVIHLPAPVYCLEQLYHPLTGSRALLASLANGEIRLYHETTRALLSIVKLDSPAVAIRFGQYGRERGVLVAACQSGALSVRILSRASSDLSAFAPLSAPPAEQEVPLRVPKKTSLYIEQAQHERDNAAAMHRAFQRELYRVRLDTARAYVKLLTDQQGPVRNYAGSSLRLSARVQGLGPIFRMRLFIENTGRRTICSVPVIVSFNK